ncbi:MAG TPA: PrpR N-terminal domain-containing protein [Candidatus Dormibacteraeota bacterium]|nr:PrpR N-terminal domain-containing protein [Candidatus Dormibacteraeota bacterium]
MKKKVMFIAPYQGLANIVNNMELPNELDVEVKVGNLDEGAKIAAEAEKSGFDFIISRGGTATKIENMVSIPVIHIDITGYDILRIFTMITGVDTKVALVGFPNISEGAATICSILEYDVTLVTIDSQEEVEETLYDLKSKGYSMVIGDVVTVTYAKKVGLQGILLTSGKEAVLDSFKAGARMSDLLKNNRNEYLITQKLFESLPLPTVVLNKDKEIVYHNNAYSNSLVQTGITAKPGFYDFLKNISGDQESVFYDEDNSLSLMAKGFLVEPTEKVQGILMEIAKKKFNLDTINKEEVIENPHIIGNTDSVQKIKELINVYGESEEVISLIGENGTGKKTVAKAIHYRKFGPNIPFYIIDGADLADGVSGEVQSQISRIRLGSVMINDMESISKKSQKEILALINQGIKVFLAYNLSRITNDERNLKSGSIDIMTNTRSIHLPPLRQRYEDIKYFMNYYLSELNAKKGMEILGVKKEALTYLEKCFWSGNITQLKQVISEISSSVQGHYIELKDVEFLNMYSSLKDNDEINLKIGNLKDIEKQVIQKVMEREKGNQSNTAKILGINRSTLWRKLND